MEINRTKRSVVNIGVGIVNRVVSIILPFVLRTVMIQKLGVEYLGLDSLFASILSVLSLSELGFSSAVVYALYKPIATKETEYICKILYFYKRVYRIVGVFILALGFILLPFLQLLIASEYPNDINIHIVYVILLLNTSLSYLLFAYKSSIIIASMRNDVDSLFDLIRSIISHFLQILVLLLLKNYYMYVLVLPFITVINNIARSVYIDRKYPEYHPAGKLSKDQTSDIMSRVYALIGHKIGGVVFNSADTIVISAFLGLTVLGKYSNYHVIYLAVFGFQSVIFQSFQAVIGNSIAMRSREENHSVFNELLYINAGLTCFCTTCFVSLYQTFMKIWMGAENMLPTIIPVLFSIHFLVRSLRRVCYTFKEAAGLWKEDAFKPYISSAVNITFNIILVSVIGLPGILISSIGTLLLVEIPWETRVLFKIYFQIKPKEYFFNIIIYYIISIIAAGTTYCVCLFFGEGYVGLLLRIVVCMIVPNALFILLTHKIKAYKQAKIRLINLIRKIV